MTTKTWRQLWSIWVERTFHLRKRVGLDIHLSSSNCLRTSPMIWPTLCKALMLSSVVSKLFCRPLISIRRALSFASHSLDSRSLFLYDSRACCLSGSPPPSIWRKEGLAKGLLCWRRVLNIMRRTPGKSFRFLCMKYRRLKLLGGRKNWVARNLDEAYLRTSPLPMFFCSGTR
jgi:hypothetical protein